VASTGESVAIAVDTTMKTLGSWSDVFQGYGIRVLEQHYAYPRIIWVPIGGEIAQTSSPGGRIRTSNVRTKHLRSGVLEHDVYIHYDSYENTENLWKAFIASCVLETVGYLKLGDFQWVTDTDSHDYSVEGYMIKQRVSVQLPIHDDDRATQAVTTQAKTVTFQGHAGGGDVDVCT